MNFILKRQRKNSISEREKKTKINDLFFCLFRNLNESISGNKLDKRFFFFAQKTFPNEQNLIEQCEELLRELDVPISPEIVVEEQSSPVPQVENEFDVFLVDFQAFLLSRLAVGFDVIRDSTSGN